MNMRNNSEKALSKVKQLRARGLVSLSLAAILSIMFVRGFLLTFEDRTIPLDSYLVYDGELLFSQCEDLVSGRSYLELRIASNPDKLLNAGSHRYTCAQLTRLLNEGTSVRAWVNPNVTGRIRQLQINGDMIIAESELYEQYIIGRYAFSIIVIIIITWLIYYAFRGQFKSRTFPWRQ